jgi:chitinase
VIRVSYDDNETWMLKKQYAADKCLGGTLAWAVDMKTISQGNEISAD